MFMKKVSSKHRNCCCPDDGDDFAVKVDIQALDAMKQAHSKRIIDDLLPLSKQNGLAEDDKIFLELLYHHIIINLCQKVKWEKAKEYLLRNTQENSIAVENMLYEKMKDIVNFPTNPSFDDIFRLLRDDAVQHWFESAPHVYTTDHYYWSVRDVTGTVNSMVENNQLKGFRIDDWKRRHGDFPYVQP